MERADKQDTPLYTISIAAGLLGVSVQTLRMYEREGLIIPFKKESNQRLYSERDLERLRCVRATINEEKISIEGIKRILSLIPCWAVLGCSEKDRSNCNAYNGFDQPCWLFNHKSNHCETRDCRACEVYADFGQCRTIKTRLKELLPAGGDKADQ